VFTIKLGFPNKALSPNGRAHWAVKAKAAKSARSEAWAAVLEVRDPSQPKWRKAALRWLYHPRTKHAVDLDNLIASSKNFQDGIADALFMNDKDFVCTYEIGEPVKGGLVVVTIKEMEE
jgi:crossover junction endodeoxyribonuclease RusA